MARLGIAPHVAGEILNHQAGTISGVAAVYQRHEFLTERQEALERWEAHVATTLAEALKPWVSSVTKSEVLPDTSFEHSLGDVIRTHIGPNVC